MIRYKKLIVQNYKSIKEATLEFTSGLYCVIGDTKDGGYTSNGAGKSSILQALTLVLYNKDFQGAPLDSVSNRYTGVPFKITLEMDVEKEAKLHSYVVVNSRATKKITVRRNGKVISNTTNTSLKVLAGILGMTEATFKFTHYITTNSILELTKNLSSATLFNEVLQVNDLRVLGDDLLAVSKEYVKKEQEVSEQHSKLLKAQKILKVTSQYDLEDLNVQRVAKQLELDTLEGLLQTKIGPLAKELKSIQEGIRETSLTLKHKETSKVSGVCSLCGTLLLDPTVIEELKEEITQLHQRVEEETNKKVVLEAKVSKIRMMYSTLKVECETVLNRVTQDYEVGRQLQEIHAEEVFCPTIFQSVSEELHRTREAISTIQGMREAIRTGKVYEEVMQEFFTLVNYNIQRYRQVINFQGFEVEALAYHSGMVALIKHQGVEIPVESLSNGEKARLSLLLLSALLESMTQVTNSESNFLAIDEATASFDKSGIEELALLFQHLKALNQAVFIITHGTELQDVQFDGQLVIHKEDKVSYATFSRFN